MRSFKNLTEATGNAVFTLGRFNPPTTGHEKLITKLSSKAGRDPMYVFPTHSQDPKRNPLPHSLKIAYMKKMFKKYAKNIQISKARNVFEVAKILYDKGHKSITMVVGSDRVAEFSSLLKKYNGTKSTHGFYEFDNIDVVSAGARDPDSEGVEGMSASKMRAAAQDGDKDSFIQGLPSSFKEGEKLYRDIRSNMGVREERNMGEMTDIESLRDQYLTGKVWKVGDIVEANGVKGEVIRRGTNYLTMVEEDGKVHKVWLHDITLDERNYRKEYDNYQGKPDQVARRSSRNKARRVMGDKTKIGMDVGHKDNNPLNNDPKNLKNEDPSKNRREPRLREEDELDELRIDPKTSSEEDIKNQIKYHEKMRDKFSGNPRAKKAQNDDIKRLQGILKDRGFKEEVELDELSSMLPWLNRAVTKASQITHPKGWTNAVQRYVSGMKDKEHQKHPSAWAAELARQYKGVEPRDFVKYINKLVDKGELPKELKAEYDPMVEKMSPLAKLQKFDKSRVAAGKKPIFTDKKTKKNKKEEVSSFKDFVNHINNK